MADTRDRLPSSWWKYRLEAAVPAFGLFAVATILTVTTARNDAAWLLAFALATLGASLFGAWVGWATASARAAQNEARRDEP